MMRGKHIVIGVTGGIAAYKAVYLVRQLQESGAEVRVTMTGAATRFVGRDTFAALTRHDVPVRIFPESSAEISTNWTQHIQWAEWADLIAIVPCTANTLAKIVHGFSDSMLTATILAARCPVLLCPTMDGEMYQAPATRANLEKAGDLGFHLMPPEHGYLASGMHGTGRLPEPDTIMAHILRLLSEQVAPADESREDPLKTSSGIDNKATGIGKRSSGLKMSTSSLSGKKILVTAGATREFLDPVRFLSNPSTGKMGIAMAEAALSLGAEVTLLHADPVDTTALPPSIKKERFTSTDDLFNGVKTHADDDVIIMTAAVSDFRPAKTHPQKVKKENAEMQVTLERTPDILQWLGDRKPDSGQILIGFAMETEDLVSRAREKRIRKNIDWIVANDLTGEGSGFAVDTNRVFLIGAHEEAPFDGAKSEVARRVLHHIFVS